MLFLNLLICFEFDNFFTFIFLFWSILFLCYLLFTFTNELLNIRIQIKLYFKLFLRRRRQYLYDDIFNSISCLLRHHLTPFLILLYLLFILDRLFLCVCFNRMAHISLAFTHIDNKIILAFL